MEFDVNHIIEMMPEITKAFGETLYMISISIIVSIIIGLPLGVLLFTTSRGLFLENPFINTLFGFISNIIRSIPFIILLVTITPLTVLLVGSPYGPTAASVSLSLAAIPFFARIVETSFREIDKGVIEAAIAVGATPWMIIKDVLLPEAKPSMIQGLTLTLISIVGFSAMAGFVGGGGIGDLAIRYGYQRYDFEILIVTVLILIIMVQVIQFIGDKVTKAVDKS